MSDNPEVKDFGKFPFDESELRGIVGSDTIPTLTLDSEILVLKDLADRLFKEAEQLELQKQRVVAQLVAVNQTLQSKVAEHQMNGFKAKRRGQNGENGSKRHTRPTVYKKKTVSRAAQ
jgi:hypothetical protein